MAEALKDRGNAAFKAGRHQEAVSLFSEAIALDASNHVLYSNRSAAQVRVCMLRAELIPVVSMHAVFPRHAVVPRRVQLLVVPL